MKEKFGMRCGIDECTLLRNWLRVRKNIRKKSPEGKQFLADRQSIYHHLDCFE